MAYDYKNSSSTKEKIKLELVYSKDDTVETMKEKLDTVVEILSHRYKNAKIVFIWDEFSDYFRQNNTSLGEFQKIVSICQEKPFYFIIVTHPLSSLAKNYDSSDKTNPYIKRTYR